MDDFETKPWLVIGATGARFLYGELLAELRAAELEVGLVAGPRRTDEGLRLLGRALVAEVDVTLVDPLLRPGELTKLGVEANQVDIVRRVPGRPELTAAELMCLAGGASRMRLGLYTSGSTGIPARVEHAMGTLARNVRTGARHAADIWALTFRPTHIAGVQVWLQAIANGNTLVDLTGLPPQEAIHAMANHGVTHISASPTYYRALLGEGVELGGVRSVTLGGELVSPDLLGRLQKLFPTARIHNIYALTEAGTLLASSGDLFRIPEDRRAVIEIENGRLRVHRSLLGEFSQAKALAAGGWYDTGDLVEEVPDGAGRFRFVAREREWANIGGIKVNPHEVEAAMHEHPDVAGVRVIAQSNSVMGQILVAEVVLGTKADDGEMERRMRAWLAKRLHPAKIPRIIRFVAQLQTTYSGKTSRK